MSVTQDMAKAGETFRANLGNDVVYDLVPVIALLPCDCKEGHLITLTKSGCTRRPCLLCLVRRKHMRRSKVELKYRDGASQQKLLKQKLKEDEPTESERQSVNDELSKLSLHHHIKVRFAAKA